MGGDDLMASSIGLMEGTFPLPADRFQFQPATFPASAFNFQTYMQAPHSLSKREAKALAARMREGKVWQSSFYEVVERTIFVDAWDISMTHLSFKRRDREVMHDWREGQKIKNAICGSEREAVELYPAESRLVDTSNQYHLWVLGDGQKWPFGQFFREVSEDTHGSRAKQRAFS